MSPWSHLFWLMVAFGILLALNRWIIAHIQGLGYLISSDRSTATWFYFLLFLPGILIHEISHYLMAVLLRVKTGKFTLWPHQKGRGQVVLGSVEVRGADPLRHSIIGAAPLVVGMLVIFFLSRWLYLDELGSALLSGDISHFSLALGQSLATADFWLWFYLLFVVVNTMLPSPADRVYWLPIFLVFGLITLMVVGLDWLPKSLLFSDLLEANMAGVLSPLTSALLTAVAVNLFFMGGIYLCEVLIVMTTGRRIQY